MNFSQDSQDRVGEVWRHRSSGELALIVGERALRFGAYAYPGNRLWSFVWLDVWPLSGSGEVTELESGEVTDLELTVHPDEHRSWERMTW